jgi:hypothetical protein
MLVVLAVLVACRDRVVDRVPLPLGVLSVELVP